LMKLGIHMEVPAFPIHQCQVIFPDRSFRLALGFRVVRREEFDYALFCAACERGIVAHPGEVVIDLVREPEAVTVCTPTTIYRARMVIGADGANSIIARRLGLARADRISRLIEIVTPADAQHTSEFVEHTAVFDFTPISRGVQGYYWDFPCLNQGMPTVNRGLFDSRVRPYRPRAALKSIFAEQLAARGIALDEFSLQGHPERWFDAAAKHSVPRVLLAGDAAGVEPFLGEGISYALNFGLLAAQVAIDALARNDFSFSGYERCLRTSDFGRSLRWKRFVAHHFYR